MFHCVVDLSLIDIEFQFTLTLPMQYTETFWAVKMTIQDEML